jgi:cyclopropane-fatty-acyl-phospholipid synthase
MPSIAQIGAAVEKSLVMEGWHQIGPDYDKTLMAWFENFDSGWDRLKAKYGERFYRLWKYYLLYCAGSYRAGQFNFGKSSSQSITPPESIKPFGEVR